MPHADGQHRHDGQEDEPLRRAVGRPHKGDRKDVRARPPREVAETIESLAEDAGQYVTDYATELLRIGLRHRNELPGAMQPLRLVLPQAE